MRTRLNKGGNGVLGRTKKKEYAQRTSERHVTGTANGG